jgi:ATP-dependent Clp protease ATP-binding subunit ClpC
MVPDGSDLAQLYAEAQDIARNVQQPETTAHDLLALFTFENRAQVLLKERGIDEDALLSRLDSVPVEPPDVRRQLPDKTRELAKRVGSNEADCLHLLICLTGLKESLAYGLLERCGVPVPQLRNTALSYFTGRMPRRLQNLKTPPCRPMPAPISASTTSAPQAEARPMTAVAEAVQAEPLPEPRERYPRKQEPGSDSDLELEKEEFPWLCELGRNLTLLAEQQRIDPVIGRGREIEEVIDILGKRRANNPLLVGEPGVGKTAVVEGVAQQMLRASSPGTSGRRIVVELDVASIVAGTQLRGSFSEKLNGIKDEVRRAGGRVVVFIDEIHTLVGAGSTGEGPQDAANELKAALARGEFPCIGATTHDEYRKFIQSDPALERRFTAVTIAEPSVPQAVEMLHGVVPHYEAHHRVHYEEEALEAAAVLSTRYLVDRCLPDKALAVLDQAGSRARRQGLSVVDATEIARTVARMAGLPEARLTLGERERLLALEDELQKRVVGHRLAIERVATAVRRNSAGFHTRRPVGSFLFVGPTGVGKTELARAVAEVLYGTRDALVQIDMSEMSEPHAVARLIGAPPGYVGYGEAGQLTEAVRRRPSSVVLLDEIEKAHRDVTMLLLQLLDEGRLSDSRGRHIDFSNTVVILTTNLGSEAFGRGAGPMGFGRSRDDDDSSLERAVEAARHSLAPELWNRVDEKLGFPPLTREQVERIAVLLLAESSARLAAERRIQYRVEAPVVAHLLDHGGYDRELGARPMRQTIARLVEGPVAERILRGDLAPGGSILVSLRAGRLEFGVAPNL